MTAYDEPSGDTDYLFDVAIATIFAREFLEGAIIIGNYRTVIKKSNSYESEDERKRALREVTKWATIATIVAILVVLAIAIPLALLSKDLDESIVEIIEGVSKVVAAVCILQLSVKIPVWLNVYEKVSILPCKKKTPTLEDDNEVPVSFSEIRFNVSWNLWREVAECGVFLIPFFLGGPKKAIPLSALAGIGISMVLGGLIYIANQKLTNKIWLAMFMSLVTGFLSIGLFVGGCHEFEEVWGETQKVWVIDDPTYSHKAFPFVLVKPFGYSASRTVLQIACFWSWTFLFFLLHGLKWRASRVYRTEKAALMQKADGVNGDIELAKQETGDVSSDENTEVEGTTSKDKSKGFMIPLPDQA